MWMMMAFFRGWVEWSFEKINSGLNWMSMWLPWKQLECISNWKKLKVLSGIVPGVHI